MDPIPHAPIDRFLDERIAAGDFPGAVYAVDTPGGLAALGARGLSAVVPGPEPATLETIYDLASLTKPLATASLAVVAARGVGFGFDEPVSRWLPELADTDKEHLTVAELGGHRSGLPAWLPLYVTGGGIPGYLAAIAAAPLESPPGARAVYSDCGYILLGEAIARIGRAPLDSQFARHIAGPAGLFTAVFRPDPTMRHRIAPTEQDCATERSMVASRGLGYDGWRRGVIRGEVHDGNAWGLGGVAGHAGLFGSVMDVVLIGRELHGRGVGLFEEADRRLFSSPHICDGEVRSFGWQLAASRGSAAYGVLPNEAYGHTGFTGTSVWIDPSSARTFVLLTNRIHPDNRGIDMNSRRRDFHRLASRLG